MGGRRGAGPDASTARPAVSHRQTRLGSGLPERRGLARLTRDRRESYAPGAPPQARTRETERAGTAEGPPGRWWRPPVGGSYLVPIPICRFPYP